MAYDYQPGMLTGDGSSPYDYQDGMLTGTRPAPDYYQQGTLLLGPQDTGLDSANAASPATNYGGLLKVGGGLFQGLGSVIQGFAQSNAMNFQAQSAENNAGLALEQGRFDANRSQLIANQRMGAMRAGYGASGVSSTSGSAAAVLMASAANAELDRLNILHGADIRATAYENQASLDRTGAENSLNGGLLGGVAGLLTSGAALMML